MQMYCVKCRAKKNVEVYELVTMRNGKQAAKALCPTCGTGMYKIGGMDGILSPEERDKQRLISVLQSKL